MESLNSYYVKTHLSQILSHVEMGVEYIVTKHGRQVAKLTPFLPTKKIL